MSSVSAMAKPAHETDDEMFEYYQNLNVGVTFRLSREALPSLASLCRVDCEH